MGDECVAGFKVLTVEVMSYFVSQINGKPL
jgi:hypothetical protein